MSQVLLLRYYFKKLLWVGFLTWGLLLANVFVAEAQSADLPVGNSWLTVGLRPVISLKGDWEDEGGKVYSVPFVLEDGDDLVLNHSLILTNDSLLSDTLFLYLRGLGWSAEVELNGILLGLTEDSFGEMLFPIPRAWLGASGTDNRLTFRLSRDGAVPAHYPPRFLGLLEEGWLLTKDTVLLFPREPVQLSSSDSVVVYAPWPVEKGFGRDKKAFLFALAEIMETGCRNLWFPFEPPADFLVAAADLGFKRVANLDGCKFAAWYNFYPAGEAEFPRKFWKDENGERTVFSGKFYPVKEIAEQWLVRPNQTMLVLILLLPLMALVLYRALVGQIFDGMFEYVSKAKIYLDLIKQNKFLKSHQTFLLNILRMLILAIGFASFAYFLQSSGQFHRLNILTSESLVYKLVHPGRFSLLTLTGFAFVFLAGVSILKYGFAGVLTFVFHLKMTPVFIRNLDVFSSFPFNVLLILPAWFIFFASPAWWGFILVVWQIIFLLFFARKLFTTFQGLSMLSPVSLALKILYICTLEILPWIILL